MSRGGQYGSLPDPQAGSTNPFSDSFIETRLACVTDEHATLNLNVDPDLSLSLSEKTDPFNDSFIEARLASEAQTCQDTPITDLNLDGHNSCRLLLQPASAVDLHVSPEASTSAWVDLLPLQSLPQSPTPVRCLAVYHGPADIGVRVNLPLPIEFFFDSQSDAVEVRNRSAEVLLDIRRLDDTSGQVPIAPFASGSLEPGAWTVCAFGKPVVFQLLLFSRRHRLDLVQQSLGLLEVPGSTTTKRRYSARLLQKSIASSQLASRSDTSNGWEVIKPVTSLTEATGAQTVRVTGADGSEYSVLRMSNAGPSTSSDVFAARLDQYKGRLVVVKVLKPTISSSAASRAISWAREYRIHERLRSDTIVELYGGDARVDALFLAHVNAKDLAHQTWCLHPSRQGLFRGTDSDAMRVLLDMSRALAYLRKEHVLHNDIKPRNILYSRARGATLIDFGLGSSDGDAPSAGGTPWYVPPEFMAGGQRAAPADVWALGIVMLYLLRHVPLPDAGKQVPAWQIREVGGGRSDKSTSAAQCMARWLGHVENTRKALLSKSEASDGSIKSIVLQMLEPIPQDRIAADELLRRAESLSGNVR